MTWISVEERLPEVGQSVWYYFKIVGVHHGWYARGDDGEDVFYGEGGWLGGDVTHWQPYVIPEPPA